MRIHARLLDALHDRSAQVVNPLRAAKRPRRREALTFFDHVELSGGYGFEPRGSDPCDTVDVIRSVPFYELPPFPRQAVGAVA